GRHFSTPLTIANLLSISHVTGIGDVRANSLPDIAVGPNGNVHVVYDAQPALGGKDRSDIFYLRSTDGGNSFSQPVRLNDDNTQNSQLFPSVAVTSGGAVGVEWWDRRNSPKDCLTDVYMTISHDSGTSFGPNFRVTRQNFVFTPIEQGLAGGYHGDYLNMTTDGETFFPSWSSEARGNPDAYMGIVPADTDPLAPDFGLAAQKVYDALSAGGSADYPVSISSSGTFSGALSFDAYPQIAGVTVSLNRQGSSQLLTAHVETSPDSPAGSYLFTVTGSGGGKVRATEFWVNILPKSDQIVRPLDNVSNTPGYTNLLSQPQVDSAGNLHMAFNDDSDSVEFGTGVFYARSSDGGRTYSSPILVSRDGQDADTPVIAAGSDGNVFIAWQYLKLELVDGVLVPSIASIAVSRSSDSGATFSLPVDISANSGGVGSLVGLNQDPNGGLEVFYIGSAGSGSQSIQGLLAVRSLDSGKTFSDPFAISSAGQEPEFTSIAVDKNGALLVIYTDIAGLTKNRQTPIFACRSTDGQTFSQPVQISPADVFIAIFAPVLELGADGSAYVLYESFTAVQDPTNPSLIELSSPSLGLLVAPDGKTFAQAGHIPTEGFQPAMLVGPGGRIYVSFVGLQDLSSGGPALSILVARSEDRGASFSIPVQVTNSPAGANDSVMLIDGHGNLNAAWDDLGPGLSLDVFMAGSVDGGVTFGSPINVSANIGDSVIPFLALQADGNIALLWNDDSAENTEVFSALLAPPAPAAPDFAPISQSLSVARGSAGSLVLSISRPGGFSGSVTVTAPSTLPQGVHISPSQVSTTTTNATFTLAVDRKHVKRGPRQLDFTATDGSGRTKSATIALDVE
ncbi:MAG TPA: sialidase family protein, partial [Blastocatellia bacterium]|nr:sialidase family protein [Blastocatellia bacterium]